MRERRRLGYLAQAVVTVVNSLVSEEWEYVQIKPDTQLDLVDIVWYYQDQKPKVVQFKTSKNSFMMPNIRKWITLLIQDYPDADTLNYSLLGLAMKRQSTL
ncbi:hypothetical protein [Paenibacillus sp. FSL K6-2524]|uniref:hypothetical protein n=1 Tax=Paenibacillus sp. FSL K6-2524 TaxID=2954516 RepID=UPI0030FC8755